MINVKKIGFIFLVGLVMSLGLFINPGYFSHDEIGWGIKATSVGTLSDIKYYSIFHYNEFHYRPLNFNLWLLTSYYLFEHPQLYHLLLVFFGLVNASLIYSFLKKEAGCQIAFFTALTSSIMPTIVFVNGWIGTMADVFWFMFCCISLIIHQVNRKQETLSPYLLVLSLLFFLMSLMFKETAVVFPGILFIYITYSRYHEYGDFRVYKNKADVSLFLLSSLLFVSYLMVRYDFLFPSNGGGYGTSIHNIPVRLLEYIIYPFLINNIEIHGLFTQHSLFELSCALLIHLVFIGILCGKDFSKYVLYFSCYFVSTVPMLILDMSLPHYIYASGFVIAFGLSALFLSRCYKKKIISVVFFVMLAVHGINVQKSYVFTGEYQNNFVNTLYSVIKSNDKNSLYIINPEFGSASWIAIRAIAFRESIDDVKIRNRVYFNGEQASESSVGIKRNLSLDTKGRVFLVEDSNDVQ